jgi:hypothetical protein
MQRRKLACRKILLTELACIAPQEVMNVVSAKDTMADYSHILFNKSPAQLRLLGAPWRQSLPR